VDRHWEGEGRGASCAFCALLAPLFKRKIVDCGREREKLDWVGGRFCTCSRPDCEEVIVRHSWRLFIFFKVVENVN